jgi:hypothetical protein
LQCFLLFGRRVKTIFECSFMHICILISFCLKVKNYFEERTAIHLPPEGGSLLAGF